MKWFRDGDQICIVRNDFVNLQESPAVFYPFDCELAKTVRQKGHLALPIDDLRGIYNQLNIDVFLR